MFTVQPRQSALSRLCPHSLHYALYPAPTSGPRQALSPALSRPRLTLTRKVLRYHDGGMADCSTTLPAAGSSPLRSASHEAFARACLTMAQRRAFVSAYPNSARWKQGVVDTKASELARREDVRARVQWLKGQVADRSIEAGVLSKLEVCQRMSGLIDGDNEAIAVRAAERLSKMMGYDGPDYQEKQPYPPRIPALEALTVEELRAFIAMRPKSDPAPDGQVNRTSAHHNP